MNAPSQALVAATLQLQARANELRHQLDAGSPQGEGADAMITRGFLPLFFQRQNSANRQFFQL